MISIEPRCKCTLHNQYQTYINKCEDVIREQERIKQEERDLQHKLQQDQIKQQRENERQVLMQARKQKGPTTDQMAGIDSKEFISSDTPMHRPA